MLGMKRRRSNKVRPEDGLFRYSSIGNGGLKDIGSRSNLSINDGTRRFVGLSRRDLRTEDILSSVDETVENVLQDAGVSPRPSDSRAREIPRKLHTNGKFLFRRRPPPEERTQIYDSDQLRDVKKGYGNDAMYLHEDDNYEAKSREGVDVDDGDTEYGEDDEEEIMFTHDMQDARLHLDISESMTSLRDQIFTFRQSILTLAETREKARMLEV